MTEDELDRMARAFASDPPPTPDEGAKRAAMAAAMAAFEKNRGAFQAEAGPRRLTQDRTVGFGNWMRTKAMQTFEILTSRTALIGAGSFAVFGLSLSVISVVGDLSHEFLSRGIKGSEPGWTQSSPPAPREADSIGTQIAKPTPLPSTRQAPRTELRIQGRASEAEEASAAPRAPIPTVEFDADDFVVKGLIDKGRGEGLAQELGRSSTLGAAEAPPAPVDMPAPGYREQGRDRFEAFEENAVKRVAEAPVSTFSIDVDTASYALIRRHLNEGILPPRDAVRVEEMINYFAYDYPAPDSPETPFRADVAITPTPWNAGTELLRIGLQGYALPAEERPRANLVFLIDSSGSMNSPDKLPLLINGFRMLVETLGPEDRVSIVAYAGSAGTVLEPTDASEKGKILAALERLSAGGSTAGGEGIRQAYALAEANFDTQGVNRVFLATDGDFNVGIRYTNELESFVERKRDGGVLLSVLGFGRGNLNDQLMQALAQAGNGQALYIDTLAEAQKALVEEAGGSLFPIAKDVKIQIEFNPAAVSEYRLIGYETRALAREDFNNDKVDAGEIGSGHRVTALYEITPAGSAAERIEPLRYQSERTAEAPLPTEPDEIAFLKIRHKAPDGGPSELTTRPITPNDRRADREADWAAAVAAFGQVLRGGTYIGEYDLDAVIALAQTAKGEDPYGHRAEFIRLVRLAKSAAALDRQRP